MLFERQTSHDNVALVQTHADGTRQVFFREANQNKRLSGAEAQAFLDQASSAGFHLAEFSDDFLIIDRGLDLQAHLRFPGQAHKETLEGGMLAAFEGGYDSVVAMPNTSPFLDTAEKLSDCLNGIRELGFKEVKVGQTAAATVDMKGEETTDIDSLKQAGAVGITDDGWGVKESSVQVEVFKACARNDLLFMQHAERPGHGGFASKSRFQTENNVPEYPRDAESWMVKRDLELLEQVPEARYHVLHVTTALSVEAIAASKQKGLRVTAEVSPHHLCFCNEDIPDDGQTNSTNYKMNPPLFLKEDQKVLRQALAEGVIDCVSTDHAPHGAEEKSNPWVQAPFGTRGLATALPALCTLSGQGILDYADLELYFSKRPREVLALDEFSRAQGFVVVDKTKQWTVGEDDLPGLSKNSIFLGYPMHGRIVAVLSAQGYYASGN